MQYPIPSKEGPVALELVYVSENEGPEARERWQYSKDEKVKGVHSISQDSDSQVGAAGVTWMKHVREAASR